MTTSAQAKAKLQKAKPREQKPGIRLFQILTESWLFKNFILLCIILNAITLGVDAHFGESNPWHHLIEEADVIFLGIFTAELVLEFLAQGPRRYFKDGWNWFDFFVIGVSYLSMSAFSAMRTLRVLRVLRLVSSVPQMRRVVEALIGAMPGILAAMMILSIIFYIGAVMATTLFGATHEQFAGLGVSALTLFQLTQFDGWGDMIADLDKTYPYAWAFFIGFNVLAAFAVLNLFVGVIVDAVQETRSAEVQAALKSVGTEVDELEEGVGQIAVAQVDAADVQKVMLDEIRALRTEIAALRGAPPPAAPAG